MGAPAAFNLFGLDKFSYDFIGFVLRIASEKTDLVENFFTLLYDRIF